MPRARRGVAHTGLDRVLAHEYHVVEHDEQVVERLGDSDGARRRRRRIVSIRSVSTTVRRRHDSAIAGAPTGWIPIISACSEMIGIQPVGAPAMALSWRRRTVVETDRILETIADGVAGRCPIPEVLDDLLVVLDDVMLVREDSIKAGMRMLYEHAGLVVEPSAALGVAAVLEAPERFAALARHHDPVRKQRGPCRLRAVGSGTGRKLAPPWAHDRSASLVTVGPAAQSERFR